MRLSEGVFLFGHISIFPKNCSFYGLYEFEVCRSPIYFKAVGFLESLCRLFRLFLSRTIPKQYRLSVVVVG